MGAFQRDIESTLRDFVACHNNERYHESLDNVTPADEFDEVVALTGCVHDRFRTVCPRLATLGGNLG